MTVELLKDKWNSIHSDVRYLNEIRTKISKKLESQRMRLQKVEGYELLLAKAIEVLDFLKDKKEKDSKGVVEDLVSYGLNAIFNEQEIFRITLETKAKAIYAYLGLGEDKQDLVKMKGGGYIDLISVLTVLTLLLKEKPVLQRFIVLDESFAEVGREHLEKVGEFLKFLVQKLGLTIVLITHSNELLQFADRLYRVDKKGGGFTTFDEVKNGKLE